MSKQINKWFVLLDIVHEIGTDALIWNPTQPPPRGGAPRESQLG